jgi:hypothetical protein
MLFMVVATALLTLPHSVGLKSIRVAVVAVWLTWAMAMSEVANSWWGTMQTLPLAGRQAGAAGGKPWQELVVTVTHLAAGLALIIALACGLNSRELLAEHSGYNVREGGLE